MSAEDYGGAPPSRKTAPELVLGKKKSFDRFPLESAEAAKLNPAQTTNTNDKL
jgi:hypothetical protein